MKKISLIIALFVSAISFANAQNNTSETYVTGYTRSNGTYVQGHYRTVANSTINDNYSTYPNVNPHTNKAGTIKPDYYSTPTYSQKSLYNSPPTNKSYSPPSPKPSTYSNYSTPSTNLSTYKSLFNK